MIKSIFMLILAILMFVLYFVFKRDVLFSEKRTKYITSTIKGINKVSEGIEQYRVSINADALYNATTVSYKNCEGKYQIGDSVKIKYIEMNILGKKFASVRLDDDSVERTDNYSSYITAGVFFVILFILTLIV